MSKVKKPVFITGNADKAQYLSRYLGIDLEHKKLDLTEIQSLNLHEVVTDKARRAYEILKQPVLVEDVGLQFKGLGQLPGPFIKFFIQEIPFEELCRMLDGKDRSARAACVFAYFDGTNLELFEGGLDGTIAEMPRGGGGYGWDKIFIPSGYDKTRAELSEAENKKTYLQIKPIEQVRIFLQA